MRKLGYSRSREGKHCAICVHLTSEGLTHEKFGDSRPGATLGATRLRAGHDRRRKGANSGNPVRDSALQEDLCPVEDSKLDDLKLVDAAKNGDTRAFRELYARYHKKVYAIAYGMLRNHDEAMDVVQESFLKVHRYLDRFEQSSSFYTWLYRLVSNQCIDHVRRNKRHRGAEYDEKVQDAEARQVPAPGSLDLSNPGDPRALVQRGEIRAAVEDCLQELSEKHRAVIVLREIQGLSYEEMSAVEDCSKGTIMSRLFHARRKMQNLLKQKLGSVVEESNATEEVASEAPENPSQALLS